MSEMNKIERYSIHRSKAMYDIIYGVLPGGVHHNYAKSSTEIPLFFDRGKDTRLWDRDGNEYLDLYARFGAMFLGHDNKKLSKEMEVAINKYPITDYSSADIQVFQYFQKYVPCCEKIRFGLSGTEMVQNAIRLARAYTGKSKFIKFKGHFHGSADNILGGQSAGSADPIVYEDDKSVFYTEGRAQNILQEQTLQIPWNDINALEQVLDQYGSTVAAVLMEPVNINGGSILPKENYLKQVYYLCKRHHVLLIFDEIITGIHMGLGGAQGTYNVIPDICVMGKAITSGITPVSAILGRAEVMDLYTQHRVAHGGTFNGYSLGMAAVAATFSVLEENQNSIYRNINTVSRQIQYVLAEEAALAGIELITQGPDACFSYHCTGQEITRHDQLTDKIIQKDSIIRQCLQQYGIVCCHTSRFYLNASINEADVEFFRKHVRPALQETARIFRRLRF